MATLQEILTLEPSYQDYNEYATKFELIASTILNNCELKVCDNLLRIMEIEIYWKNNDDHDDPFVHCSQEQNIPYMWYFHKSGNTFKSGTYKGLDITFGNQSENSYGGILIRSIKHNNNVIEGPCNVVNYILKLKNVTDIPSYIAQVSDNGNIPLSVLENDNFKLVYNDQLNFDNIYQSARVGLTLKKGSSEKEEYLMKNYRYLVSPKKIKKYRWSVILKLNCDGISKNDISDIVGSSVKTLEKYIDVSCDGKKMKNYYGKKTSVNDLCVLYKLANE